MFCFIVLLIVSILAIAIVSSIPQLDAGVVIDKVYEPAHTSTGFRSIKIGNTTMMQPYTVRHPDRWKIEVSGTTENGKPRTEWWGVDEILYNRIEIGDLVKRNPDQVVEIDK